MNSISNNLQYDLISELENSLIILSELIEKVDIKSDKINSESINAFADQLFQIRYQFDKQRIKNNL